MVEERKSGRGRSAVPASDAETGTECPISGRAGTMVMKSVSIFLAKGRKASVSSRRLQSDPSLQKLEESGVPRRRRKKMPEDSALKTAAQHAKLIDSLKKRTKFSKQELEILCKIYNKLTLNNGSKSSPKRNETTSTPSSEGIDRMVFRELLHNTFDILTEEAIIEHMFCCWDKDSEGTIRLEPWIMGLDTFVRGTFQEKIEFCFKVYDLNNDGFITKDEIFQLFRNCLMKQPGEEDPEEGVRDLSEMVLKKFDHDHDGKISTLDFESTVQQEPLLLEAFGQVLPTVECAEAFLLTLKPY